MRIQAALVETPGGPFTLRDIDIDKPRADETLVRITAAGLCGTDLAMRACWSPRRLPMVFGHEGAGVVEAVGDGVTAVVPGDPVCLGYRSCGACSECWSGHPGYCLRSDLNVRGVRLDGTSPLTCDGATVYGSFFGQSSFATHVLACENTIVKIPADLAPTLAAPLGCPVQTGAGTVLDVLGTGPAHTLAVFGAGAVGLSAVMAGLAQGATVIAVDPLPARRTLAQDLGATAVLDPAMDGLDEALRSLTGGGPHHAVDTTGRAGVIGRAVGVLRRRGTLALTGTGGTAGIDVGAVVSGGLRIRGAVRGDSTPADLVPRLIDLHRRGRLPIERMVTAYPFAEIETAVRDAVAGTVIKPVLTFPPG